MTVKARLRKVETRVLCVNFVSLQGMSIACWREDGLSREWRG
jgi:hypothetical protein